MELISLIMPVKNVSGYLVDCIESIRTQTYRHWELIVVNDHSTDDTSEVLHDFSQSDHRIKAYTNKGNGIIPALQTGLSHATGEFVSRFDGDDIMPPKRLEQMSNALKAAKKKTIVTGKAKYFSNTPVSVGYLNYENWLNQRIDQKDHWDWVYRECVIASPNWMVRTNDLLSIGGFDSLTYPEDYHLVLRWYQHNFQIEPLPEITLHWREHSQRTSRNSTHYDQTHFFQLKVTHFVETQLGSHNLVLWGTGPKGKLTANMLDDSGIDFQWMDVTEKNVATRIKKHNISNFQSIEALADFKLLLAVFPPKKQRQELENYLQSLQLSMGKDYWFL